MDTDIDVSGMMSSDDGGAGKPSRKRVAFTPVTRSPIVKLREREGQGVDPGRSLKGHLWMVDGGIPFPDALH